MNSRARTSRCRRLLSLVVALALSWVPTPRVTAGDPGEAADRPGQHQYTNRLINSANPYLLLHAHNPVDWYPWGPEALARARRENKPIFVSIGYSTCYWCHVAEKLLYSRPEIAALMNSWFINIKVDREQRPDLDRIYMLATQLMTGRGGWPNNVFLTPDLKPFYAGSYFGSTDGERGRPGFPSVLTEIHEGWTTNPKRVVERAERVFRKMQEIQQRESGGPAVAVKPTEWLIRGREALSRRFDADLGGFASGNGTKFPQAPILDLLLADYRVHRSADSLTMLRRTLDAMAAGGIYDHLAGGFHRYSTEPSWSIPHFEKMLYDNAQLLRIYAQAYQITGDALYRHVAIGVGRYLSGQMLAPDGGFYTAQDAEVNGEEGASYLWTREQVVSVLGAEGAKQFFEVYDLTPISRPSLDPPLGRAAVLRIRAGLTHQGARGKPVAELVSGVASLRAKLLEARHRRPQPLTDEKIVVSLNGLAIDAFVQSGRIFGNEGDLATARQAAERIWIQAYDSKAHRLQHEIFHGRAQTDGYLEDYALLGGALLSLFEATADSVWRDRAMSLADDILSRFAQPDGRLSTTPHEKELVVRPLDQGDNTQPSGTSATVDLLLRLSSATTQHRYAAAAERVISRVSRQVQQDPSGWGTMVASVSLQHSDEKGRLATNRARRSNSGAAGDAGAVSPGLPGTADHVRVAGTAFVGEAQDEIVTTVQVDEGWHVNANPASFDYLIPTAVAFEGLSPVRITYPQAVRIHPRFAPDGLDVYEGSARVIAAFPKGTLGRVERVRATLTVQACSTEVCLPPATLPVHIERAEAAHESRQ